MSSDVLHYVNDAFAEYRMPHGDKTARPRPPLSQFGDHWGETNQMFFNLHPNKSVVARPVAHNHAHDYLEMVYVYRGCMHQMVGEQYVQLNEGDFFLIDTGVSHQPWVETDSDIAISIGIRRDTVKKIMSPFGRLPSVQQAARILTGDGHERGIDYARTKSNSAFRDLVETMFCEYYRQGHMHEQVLLADFVRLIMELNRLSGELPREAGERAAQEVSVMVRCFIDEHYTSLTFDDLCAHFGYSDRHMRRLMRTFSDESFSEIINGLKIKKACEYIDRFNMPTEQIVERVGYQSTNYFCRQFKDVTGTSISDYRSQHA